jgi:hypothetical protein
MAPPPDTGGQINPFGVLPPVDAGRLDTDHIGGYRSTRSAFANAERDGLTCATRRILSGRPPRKTDPVAVARRHVGQVSTAVATPMLAMISQRLCRPFVSAEAFAQ